MSGEGLSLSDVADLSQLSPVYISAGDTQLASELGRQITQSGGHAQIGLEGLLPADSIVILTEGMTDVSLVDRHWTVLEHCKALKGIVGKIIILERDTAADHGALSGFQGLSKTLRQEWPDADISTWSVSPAQVPARDIVRALSSGVGDAVIRNGKVGAAQTASVSCLAAPVSPRKNVWFVSGGARGVTAACVTELAKRQAGSVFLLAGRSEVEAWPAYVPVTEDIKTLRNALITFARERGQKPSLPEIDKTARQLLAGQEVRETLSAIETAGARAVYLPLDIGNAGATTHTLSGAISQYGVITGLVHGAGVLADGLALKKTEMDLQRVFQPKVQGLLNILNVLDVSALRHVGLFSSASAVFGNTGQSDYAMANAWLNAVARHLHGQLPEAIVKSFCWGPWEGGMVDSTLAAHFASRGIKLIDLEDGSRIFADQILQGSRDDVELLIGDEWAA